LSGAELPRARPANSDDLHALDECIQQRFLDIGPFGMSRVLPQAAHDVRQFRPKSGKEREAVAKLEQVGYEVAFYLGGRGILDRSTPVLPSASSGLSNPWMFGVMGSRQAVQGPAFITQLAHAADLPEPRALLQDARAALTSFDKLDGAETRVNGWNVWMRPLRATTNACVACHTNGAGGQNPGLKIGDALGVALYVSRSK